MVERIPYGRHGSLRTGDVLIVRGRSGERRVRRWWVDRSTPVGEDADLYERMPYSGRRLLSWSNIVAVERVVPTNAPKGV